jgi:AAA domain
MTAYIDINDPKEEALFQLALATRRKPAQAGAQGPDGSNPGPMPIALPTIRATPFRWKNPSMIPPRRWIYGKHYIRQYLTETVAPGGYGKSTLAITEARAIATGHALLGVLPDEPTNVWYFNGEDPLEELDRRIAAACLYYHIEPSELEGRLFVDTGRQMKIILAEMTKQPSQHTEPEEQS